MDDNKYDFPNCMHTLAAAMHMQNIDPGQVTITLPRDKWWALASMLERHFRGFMRQDGRPQTVITKFTYMGFKFKPEPPHL